MAGLSPHTPSGKENVPSQNICDRTENLPRCHLSCPLRAAPGTAFAFPWPVTAAAVLPTALLLFGSPLPGVLHGTAAAPLPPAGALFGRVFPLLFRISAFDGIIINRETRMVKGKLGGAAASRQGNVLFPIAGRR